MTASWREDADIASLIGVLRGQIDHAGHLVRELLLVTGVDPQHAPFIRVPQGPGQVTRGQPRLTAPIDDRQRGLAKAQRGR